MTKISFNLNQFDHFMVEIKTFSNWKVATPLNIRRKWQFAILKHKVFFLTIKECWQNAHAISIKFQLFRIWERDKLIWGRHSSAILCSRFGFGFLRTSATQNRIVENMVKKEVSVSKRGTHQKKNHVDFIYLFHLLKSN